MEWARTFCDTLSCQRSAHLADGRVEAGSQPGRQASSSAPGRI